MDQTGSQQLSWSEENSRTFLNLANVAVPDRQRQMEMIADLIPASQTSADPFYVLELGSGEGLLAETILDRYPQCKVLGLDGSEEMRRAARQRLSRFEGRFETRGFDLASTAWRSQEQFQAVVSSLVIHHLDGCQKQALYRDLFQIILPGGAVIIADLIQPATRKSAHLAAQAWEETVRLQSLEQTGDLELYHQFQETEWNFFQFPDPVDQPSSIFDHLTWLQQAGFHQVDVYWLKAGHAIYGANRPD